jgi:HEAT repeat protein
MTGRRGQATHEGITPMGFFALPPTRHWLLLVLPQQQERRARLADLRKRHRVAAVARELMRALEDFAPRVRQRAAWCLGELGAHPVTGEALAGCLRRETNRNVRRLAYSACAKVGSGGLEETILARLAQEDGRVLEYALKALARCGSLQAVASIRRVLEQEQPAYVVRAAEAALRRCQRWW